MKTKIYKSMMILSISCLLGTFIIFCFIFYNQMSFYVENDLENYGEVFSNSSTNHILKALENTQDTQIRITIISKDGKVLYDSTKEELSNHKDRPEIIDAIKKGNGNKKRFSNTLGEETYYYAIQLRDGNILRLSKTVKNALYIFDSIMLPIIFLILVTIILSYIFAGKITNNIIKPINNVEFNENIISPYEELNPFIKMISNQRKEINKQIEILKEKNETINTIMDSMAEGMIVADENGMVVTVNKSAKKSFDIKEFENKNIIEIFRDIELIKNIQKALNGEYLKMRIPIEKKIYKIYLSPVSTGGVIILLLDITQKANIENLRKEFSANVSHELKTPLTTIYGNIEMLYNNMVRKGDEHIFYEKIFNETKHLIDIIENIIFISKLDEEIEKTSNSFEKILLNDVINHTIQSLDVKAKEKNIKIVFVENENITMKANKVQMYELFYNLIENSIKYNKTDGEIAIILLKDDSKILISVRDTGIGIPKNEQDRVFERFYRVEKSRSKYIKGSGLGLSIVKNIVLSHKGNIKLESKENEGTNINISFDLQ